MDDIHPVVSLNASLLTAVRNGHAVWWVGGKYGMQEILYD